jgi:replicative DNA helicase
MSDPTPETCLVASIVIDPSWSWEVIDKEGITAESFRHNTARKMFSKLSEMRGQGKEITQLNLANELPGLTNEVWNLTKHQVAASPAYFARAVIEINRRYALAELGQELAAQAGKPEADLDAVVDSALQSLNKVSYAGFINTSVTLREAARRVVDDLDNSPSFIPTPWPPLNEAIGGLRKGALYVLAARPGIGKSLLGLQLAAEISSPSCSVAFFSLEMEPEQLATRALASASQINSMKIDRRLLSEQEKQRLALASKDISDHLHIVGIPSKQINQLRPTLRKIRASGGGLGAVFIDYLQLLDAPGNSLYEKVTKISGQLKSLAMELDLPVVALAQLNRKAAERDGSPSLADLKDSGAIEQDADAVLTLSRNKSGNLSLMILKNRQGADGGFTLEVNLPTMSIKRFTWGVEKWKED